jgi:hypothetical protein
MHFGVGRAGAAKQPIMWFSVMSNSRPAATMSLRSASESHGQINAADKPATAERESLLLELHLQSYKVKLPTMRFR